MLTDVNTKEFWEQVKKEYRPTQQEYAFCGTSKTFSAMWNDCDNTREQEVMKFAHRFIVKSKLNKLFNISRIFLFESIGYAEIEVRIQIRRDFLDYMINKFS